MLPLADLATEAMCHVRARATQQAPYSGWPITTPIVYRPPSSTSTKGTNHPVRCQAPAKVDVAPAEAYALLKKQAPERQPKVRRPAGIVLGTLGLFLTFLLPASADDMLVPIVSVFRHWDHHWYIWLPGDPVHEAVEVMSRERGDSMPSLVWVFFTEREVPKRQTHYFNDAEVAAAVGGHFRNIRFHMTGTHGQPRGVGVALTDLSGRAVAIDAYCASEAQLVTTGAGLTNQIGHSGDRILLVFFREKNAFAENWSVMLDGVDISKPQPGQSHAAPRPASYSNNIFVGGFPFIDRRVVFDAGDTARQNVTRFSYAASRGVLAARLADGTQLELQGAGDARLQLYRHRDAVHSLEISFDPPLPSPDNLQSEMASAYRIHLDTFRDLIAGTVRLRRHDNAVVLDWVFERPQWTTTRQLETVVRHDGDGAERISLRPAPGR